MTPYYGPDTSEARHERLRVERGELPLRYAEPWGKVFFESLQPALRPGVTILDVGAGRSPILPRSHRPSETVYVGLDVAAGELSAAGPEAYDEVIVGDITDQQPGLEGRFDLIVSWQVLEHVSDARRALTNMHAYLKPGGRMVSQLSGRFAAFALLARMIPYSVSRRLMSSLIDSEPVEKFPTRYNGCDAKSLRAALSAWSEHGIIPRFKGGSYFRFWPPLERVYLAYESWAQRSGRVELATHYVIWAVK